MTTLRPAGADEAHARESDTPKGWPSALAVGAVRFARRTTRLAECIVFYRDLVGLPLLMTFGSEDGPDAIAGAIFGVPGAGLTFELVKSTTAVPVDAHEQLVLYFDGRAPRNEVARRLNAAGLDPAGQHQYWIDNDAVTFRDPDGRELVLAPWVFGVQPPPARAKAASSGNAGGPTWSSSPDDVIP